MKARKPRNSMEILERLTVHENTGLIRELLRRHPELQDEATAIAREIVAEVSMEDVAANISARVLGVGLEELNRRAGKHSWGYVEPSEAAWELLEEAVEDFTEDVKRRKEAGLDLSAERACQGMLLGLYGLRRSNSDGALGWAPDFPAEAAGQALADLISLFPRSERANAGQRILTGLGEQVGDWTEMLQRVVTEASR